MRIFLLSLIVLVSTALPVQAARFSGAYLLQLCAMDHKGRELVKGGHIACQAYISGVIDYHNVLQSMKIAPKVNICVPANVQTAKLHSIVLQFLRQNKEHDSFVAAPAVTMALYQAYPCK